jgi:ferredoxin-NADP reductase
MNNSQALQLSCLQLLVKQQAKEIEQLRNNSNQQQPIPIVTAATAITTSSLSHEQQKQVTMNYLERMIQSINNNRNDNADILSLCKEVVKSTKRIEIEEEDYRTHYQNIIMNCNEIEHKYLNVTCFQQTQLNKYVIQLKFKKPNESFNYKGGQYIHLTRILDGLTRRYSLSSVPELDGDELIIQIRIVARGRLTNWLFNQVNSSLSDQFQISGPEGNIYYRHNSDALNVVLLGFGCGGLSPLYAIVREALLVHKNNTCQFHLFIFNHNMEPAFHVEELRQLQEEYPNFFYYPCVREHNVPKLVSTTNPFYYITSDQVYILQGRNTKIDKVIFSNELKLNFPNSDVYLTGLEKNNEYLIEQFQQKGVQTDRIYADRLWR